MKTGVSMSFHPGIGNSLMEAKGKDMQVQASEKVFMKALDELGFLQGYEPHTRVTHHDHWKVNITPSSSYELTLDSEMKVASLNERELSWVHVTLLQGKQVPVKDSLLLPQHDTRIHIQTSDPVPSNSELYKFVFP